tara:strand:+ start:2472 stop:3083 length:612 start_codon:yes stop_codon:yes gene_type:complete
MFSKQKNTWKPWSEGRFAKVVELVDGRSLVNPIKLHSLYECVKFTRDVPGDIAEVGVFRGGTAKLIALFADKDKKIHLFDTFAGLPEPEREHGDGHRKGQFASDFKDVKRFLKGHRNLKFYKGFFPATAEELETQFSFVHIDTDLYQSHIDAYKYFWPRMNTGGVILFDDYGALSCKGAKKAVDECFDKKIYLPTGQCFVIKI